MNEFQLSNNCQIITTDDNSYIAKVIIEDIYDETHYLFVILNKNITKTKKKIIDIITKNMDKKLLSKIQYMEISTDNNDDEYFFVYFVKQKPYFKCELCDLYTCINFECDDVEMTQRMYEFD